MARQVSAQLGMGAADGRGMQRMQRNIARAVMGLAWGWSSLAHAATPTAPASNDPAPDPNPAAALGAHRWLFLDAPPPAPPPFPPDPAPEADEHPRRTWEFAPELGIGAPFCRGGGVGCPGTGAGPSLALAALYRLSPYVALGLDAGFADFREDAAVAGAHSRTHWVGFVVRGYFAEQGLVDPYVEIGFGRGAVESGAADVRASGAGPSTMAGAGIDFWVLPFMRVGPALSYRWTWLSTLDVCEGGACGTASVSDWGAVGSYASLAVVATIGLGREM
jgi:hypothetical protein